MKPKQPKWKRRWYITVRRDWDCMKCGEVIQKGTKCVAYEDENNVVRTPHDSGLRMCVECDAIEKDVTR